MGKWFLLSLGFFLLDLFFAWRGEHQRADLLQAQGEGGAAAAQIDNLTQANQQLQQKVAALEQQAVPRVVTDEQKKKLTEVLSKVPSSSAYVVEFYVISGCFDCPGYTHDLVNVWNEVPGWYGVIMTDDGLNPHLTGVIVIVDMEGCPPEELQFLRRALDAAGIKYTQDQNRNRGGAHSDSCAVLIGNKPQG